MLTILYIAVGLTMAASSATEEQNCTIAIDLCFVLDSSKSVCDSDPKYNPATDTTCGNWEDMIDLVYNTTSKLDIGENATRVAAVVFASKAFVRWKLPKYTDKSSLLAAIRALQFIAGNTNTTGALDVTRDQVYGNNTRKNVTKLAIIVTDGKASNMSTVPDAIGKTHAAGIVTVAVGITNAIDQPALKLLASDPKEENKTYFPVPNFNILDRILPSIQTVICHDLPFIAANYTTTTPATSSSQVCERKIDLVFVLDCSASICRSDSTYKNTDEGCDNWKAMLRFAHELSDRLTVGPNNARVAVVIFGTKAYQKIRLDSFQDRASLGQAIDQIKYNAGYTNTSGALDVMTLKAFAKTSGTRKGAQKYALIMTDGKPTNESAVQPAVDRAHKANVTTIAIGVTNQINEASVKQVSSEPQQKNQNYFLTADFQTMDTILNALQKQICNTAPATTTTTTTTKPSTTTATTTAPTPSATEAAEATYFL